MYELYTNEYMPRPAIILRGKMVGLKKQIFSSLCLLGSLICSMAHADGITSLGLAQGGDALVQSSDGATLEAGGGVTLELGYVYNVKKSPLSYRFLLGSQFDDMSGVNPDTYQDVTVKISTIPIRFMAMYFNNNIDLGAGLAYFVNTKYQDMYGNTTKFDNSVGFSLEMNFYMENVLRRPSNYYFGGRYTAVNYKGANLTNGVDRVDSVNADSFTIIVGALF